MMRTYARSSSTIDSGARPDTRTGIHMALAWAALPGLGAILPIPGSKATATDFAASGSADSQLWNAKADDQGIQAARGSKRTAPREIMRARMDARKKYSNGIKTAATAKA